MNIGLKGKAGAQREYVYIGTYTGHSAGRGIYVCEWDRQAETLTPIGVGESCVSPSFLAFHPSGRTLYAANETGDAARVTAHRIDPATGLLSYLGGVDTAGSAMCHLAVEPGGKWLAAAMYGSGHVVTVPIREDGSLGEPAVTLRNEGRGPHPRQQGPHAHEVVFTPDGKRMLLADLGLDRLFVYDVDGAGGLFPAAVPAIKAPDGEGPRHLVIRPDGQCIWALTELGNNVLLYRRTSDGYALAGTAPTLPDGFTGHAAAAELQLAADGRFLYASVRGEYDRIVRFGVAADGSLSRAVPFPSHGREPRMFSLSGDGRHMFIANQRSDNVTVVRVDPESGGLSPPCRVTAIPQACYVMCVAL